MGEVRRVARELRRNWRCKWIGSSGFVGAVAFGLCRSRPYWPDGEKTPKLAVGRAWFKARWGRGASAPTGDGADAKN
jgi:hypothetical protein